jgi:hypothetical protein
MAVVDEATQDRDTYGNPTGWSMAPRPLAEGQSPKSVVKPRAVAEPTMVPPEQVPDESAAPSAEEVIAPEAPVSDASPEPEVPFHQHPRWIERQRELEKERQEKQALQEQNRLLMEMAQRPIQAVVQAPPPAPVDPWAGLVDHPDPQTSQYWQRQKSLMEHHERVAEERAVQRLQPVIDAGRQELARISTRDFRKENPEIKPGSEEERLVVAYMNGQVDGVRHPLESAKRNALFETMKAERDSLKTKQSSVGSKRVAASTEATSGIPQTAGLPSRAGSAVDRTGHVLDQGGSWMDAAKAFFR